MNDALGNAPLVEVEQPAAPKPVPGIIDHKLHLAVERDALETATQALRLADLLAGYDSNEWELEIAALKQNARVLSTKYLYTG